MARITYGLITDIRGSIGGLTFQKNASGAIVRLKSTRVINPSNLLANQQRLLASIVAKWFTLTNEQKDGWNALAAAHPYLDGWNIAKQLNGYQNFLSNNLNLASIGLPAISDAPVYSLPAPPPAFTQNFSSTKYSLSFSAPVDPSSPVLLLYATPPVTTSNINTRLAKFLIPVGSWNSSQILDMTSSYCDYFNVTLAALLANSNANICIRAKFIDPVTGFSSIYTSNISHIESVAKSFQMTFTSAEALAALYPNYADVAFWNTQFNLPTNGSQFISVSEYSGVMTLTGGSNINVVSGVITTSEDLLSIVDTDGVIVSVDDNGMDSVYASEITLDGVLSIGDYAFQFCWNTTKLHLKNCISMGVSAISACDSLSDLNIDSMTAISDHGISDCYSLPPLTLPSVISIASYGLNGLDGLTEIHLPLCTSIAANGIANLSAVSIFDLPAVITIGDQGLASCTGASEIYIPVCTALGSTVGDNGVFTYLDSQTIELTVPAALMTCNAGQPDGDIQFLQAHNTVTIVQV